MVHPDAYAAGSAHSAAQRGDLRALVRMLKGVAEQQGLKEGDAGAFLEVLSARAGSLGRTCLHASSEGGHLDVVQYLATHARGTVCAPDNQKITPLHLACEEGHAAVVHALLQHGASAAASDMEGQTPLYLAALRGNTEVIRLLAAHGTPVSSTTLAGWTPLHGAAFYGRALTAQQLLKMGASLHIRNKEVNTPLHLACLSRHLPAIEVLLAAGADMDVPNGQGQSPASLCTSLGAQQLFEEERARRQQQQQQRKAAQEEEQQCQGLSPIEAAAKSPAPSLERLVSFNWKPTRRSIDLGFPLEDSEADGAQAAMAAATAQRRGSIDSTLSCGRALSCMRSRSGNRHAAFRDQLPSSLREEDDDGDGPDGSAPPLHSGGAGASATARRFSGLLLEGGKGSAFLEHAMAVSPGGRPAGAAPAALLSAVPQAVAATLSWLRAARAGTPLPPAPASQQAVEEEEQGLGGVAPTAKSFTFGAPAVLRPGVPTGGAIMRMLLPTPASRDGLPQPDAAAGGRPPLLPAAPRIPRALRMCSTLDGPVAAGGCSAPQVPTSPTTPPLTPPEAVPLARHGSSSSRRASGAAPQAISSADVTKAGPISTVTAADAERERGPEERKQAMYLSLSMKLAATEAAVGEAQPPHRPPLERTTSRRASMISVPAGMGAAAATLLHGSSNARAAAAALLHGSSNARAAAAALLHSSSSSAKAAAAADGFASWSAGLSGTPAPPPGPAGSASFRRRSADFPLSREGASSPPGAVGHKAGILRTSGGDSGGAAASRRFVKTVSFSTKPQVRGQPASDRPLAVTAHVALAQLLAAPASTAPPLARAPSFRSQSAGAAADATWAELGLHDGPAGWTAGDLAAAAAAPWPSAAGHGSGPVKGLH